MCIEQMLLWATGPPSMMNYLLMPCSPIPGHLVLSIPLQGAQTARLGQYRQGGGKMPKKQMTGCSDLQHFCLFVAPVAVENAFLLTEAPLSLSALVL